VEYTAGAPALTAVLLVTFGTALAVSGSWRSFMSPKPSTLLGIYSKRSNKTRSEVTPPQRRPVRRRNKPKRICGLSFAMLTAGVVVSSLWPNQELYTPANRDVAGQSARGITISAEGAD